MVARGASREPAGAEERDAEAADLPARDEAELAAEREVFELRFAASERVGDSTLRAAAGEIGMSPAGLLAFLRGARPRAGTVQKLRDWQQRPAASRDPLPEANARAAIDVLVRELDPGVRRPVVESVLRCLQAGYRQSGRAVPAWVDGMRRGLDADSDSAT